MTKKQARQKTRKLINDAARLMREKLEEKALCCGAINLENYDDDFELPRIIVNALLKDAAFRFGPLKKDNRKVAENLYRLI